MLIYIIELKICRVDILHFYAVNKYLHVQGVILTRGASSEGDLREASLNT